MQPLWKHQEDAISKLLPLKAGALLLDMGCGKSRCAIELINRWNATNVLIVSPKAVMDVWIGQFRQFSPEWLVVKLDQSSVAKKFQTLYQTYKNNGHKKLAIVVNYESVWRSPLGDFLIKNPPQVIISDELHRLKGPGGQASRYMARLGPKVDRRLGLTGTILPHSPLDAYAAYRFLDPSVFGFSFTRFRSRYALLGGYGGHVILKFINLEELHEKMYRIAYRVRAEDVLDLPPVLEQTITFELSPKAQKIYKALEQDLMAEIGEDKIISVPNVLTKLLRLQQLCGGWLTPDGASRPERVDHGKAEALKDLLEDMGAEPVVIFGRFHGDLDAAKIVCDSLKIKHCELSGRANDSDKFHKGKAQVLIAQIRSGSLGIDLTRARYEIFYSTGVSLGDLEQARKRVDRPGQTRPVTIYYLAGKKTVDEKIIKALGKRADLVRFIIDEMRNKS